MSTTWATAIPQIVDGQVVNADSINTEVNFLAARDQYLKEQLDSYSDKTVLLGYNQAFSGDLPAGTPVYFNTSGGSTAVLHPAQCGYSQSPDPAHLVPDASAFVFGLAVGTYINSTSGARYGDVYVYGLIDSLTLASLMETGSPSGEPAPGPLYLSTIEAGRFTQTPTGASVFIGYVTGNAGGASSLFLCPNVDSLNQLYFNYKVWLNTSGSTAITNLAQQIGWANASDAVSAYGFTAPVVGSASAQYYYNTPPAAYLTLDNGFTADQITNALHFKEAMPPYPGAYTMLFVSGLLQTQASPQFPNGTYIVNEDGLWWMDNTSGYQPFGNDINDNPITMQLLVTKLNPNYAESVVTSLQSTSGIISVLGSETLLPASTGNLTLQLNPSFNVVSSGATGQAVQSLAFNTESQKFVVGTSPVVNSIVQGPGIVAVNDGSGNVTLSLTSVLSGEVADIEPEEAEYVYKGLHSYLRIRKPVINQRIGFIGKLLLPSVIPAGTNLNIQLLAFAENAAITEDATFAFEYSVSKAGGAVSTAVVTNAAQVAYGNFNSQYNTAVLITDNSSNVPYFQVPNSALAPGAYVNFRIARTYYTGNSSSTPLGVIGVFWAIE